MPELTPEAEQAWRSLRRHLERSDRFTLVLLSSADPQALAEVQRRLTSVMHFGVSRLEVVEFSAADVPWVEPLDRALSEDPTRVQMRAPLWLALDRGGEDPAMNRLRDQVLASLNEQRTRLERTFLRPLLVALPTAYLPRVWEVAPDLWTIRGIVTSLPASAPKARELAMDPLGLRVRDEVPQRTEDVAALPAVAEWLRLASLAAAEPETVSPFVAHAAVEVARAHGALDLAGQIAEQGLALAQARVDSPHSRSPLDRREDLAIALEDYGTAADALGKHDAAIDAFERSLDLRRMGKLATGDFIRPWDESVLLTKIGRVAATLGRRDRAEDAFAQSLAIDRIIHQSFPDQPGILHHLAVALENVGRIAHDLGRFDQAEAAFFECVALRRRLLREVGEDGAALRELAGVLEQAGHLALERGQLEQAEVAFAEILDLIRKLVDADGESSLSLHKWIVAIHNLGFVASQLGQRDKAEQLFAESLAARSRLEQALAKES